MLKTAQKCLQGSRFLCQSSHVQEGIVVWEPKHICDNLQSGSSENSIPMHCDIFLAVGHGKCPVDQLFSNAPIAYKRLIAAIEDAPSVEKKLLDLKARQTARKKVFRTRAKEWAQKIKKSRNEAKIFDNSALLVGKLKALGYFPLLMLGKYRPQNKKWTVQLQCPFELPVVAHAVLEKIVCLFEGLLEACSPVREEVGQQERTGEEEESEREVNDEDQTGQGEQYKLGQTGRWDNMETEAQEDSIEGERVERGEIEKPMGQQERTGEEDKVEGEINDEDQRGQGEKSKIEEIERRDMQEMEIETQKEVVESERVGNGEKELGVMGCGEVLVHWLPCPSW
ncbi:hypothetical protein H4Q32_031246 [Labeo rohita]|uniref:Uncharacterized protein n=1 Tax=Labeo rohita TaxID=84645 RepID=A0ABQ8L9P6_LABRO|nr:hypothetical protein H4Q32_031246 [Labeo rohita]